MLKELTAKDEIGTVLKKLITQDELKKLTAFFSLLIEIDKKVKNKKWKGGGK